MASDDGAWHVAKLDHQNKAKHNPANNNYRCICVRPILEAPNCTIDGETYASRFVLCGIGECGLIEVTVLGGGGQSNKIKCLGNCAPGCKCTLFRLYLGGEPGGTYQPQNAKWERVAKVDTPVDPVGRYYYRCFCIK